MLTCHGDCAISIERDFSMPIRRRAAFRGSVWLQVTAKKAMKTATALRIVVALLLVAAILTGLAIVPVKDSLARLLQAVQSVGPWGPVLLAGAFIVACLLLVPGSILTLAAGFLFGVVRGTIVISSGSLLAAAAAFLIGRTLLRGWIGSGSWPIPGSKRSSAPWERRVSRSCSWCDSHRSSRPMP